MHGVLMQRAERALEAAFESVEGAPPRLLQAMRHAVFPGGGRIRPTLSLWVSVASGDDAPALADAAAAAIEIIHCASLVHDDLPCFDDADTRRGMPTVHRVHGEPTAVLVGDALTVLAFDCLARPTSAPLRVPALVRNLAEGVGARRGIIAGQALELEADVDMSSYHRKKTAALFEAAVSVGALAAGGDPDAWRSFGNCVGRAYQIADDLHDAAGRGVSEKAPGRDLQHGRPNAAMELGIDGALEKLARLRDESIASIPKSAASKEFARWVTAAVHRLVPPWLQDQPAAQRLFQAAADVA